MKQRLTDKTAIVTGASRGIGLAIAERLVAEGARVVVTGRNRNDVTRAVQHLGGAGHAHGVAGKADNVEHQTETISKALSTYGSVDFLVNNAGVNPVHGPMIELDLGAARKITEVNAIAALSWLQQAHRAWMHTNGGAVVNIASVSGIRSAPGLGFYGASKAMLISMTELLAVELAPRIRINAVAPAIIKTRFAAPLYQGREQEVAGRYPLARLGVPSDVGGVVAFLLSDDASWITGHTVVLDGGATLCGSGS